MDLPKPTLVRYVTSREGCGSTAKINGLAQAFSGQICDKPGKGSGLNGKINGLAQAFPGQICDKQGRLWLDCKDKWTCPSLPWSDI